MPQKAAITMPLTRRARAKLTRTLDSVLTHKAWGMVVFLIAMWTMFWLTFRVGGYPMAWIEGGVNALGGWVGDMLEGGPLRDLVVDGIIGGVGSVIVFLPNILILFFCISFMEDSGYMARAALLMDGVMRRIGLHGQSFIPLVMGFGCNVPGIMAAEGIKNRSSRIITVLISPFISCSARLPVYILLVGTFFPYHASLVLIAIYVVGIAVAALTAVVMRRLLFKKDDSPFKITMPQYRMPTLRTIVRDMWVKGRQYLKKMGGVILVASVAVWVLSYYPRPTEGMTAAEQREHSYLGRVGIFVEPVMRPLGIPWRGSVALVAGMGAKESIVSTMGVLYSSGSGEDPDAEMANLPVRIASADPETGVPDWTPVSALSFMVFTLLYFPCLAAVAAIRKEAGGWRWAVLAVVYSTLVAWVAAWLVWTVGNVVAG